MITSSRLRGAVVVLGLGLGIGCSEAAFEDAETGIEGSASTTPSEAETGLATTVPEWRTWRGVAVVDGTLEWVLNGDTVSELVASFWLDASLTCEVAPTIVAVEAETPPAGPELFAWWAVTLEATTETDGCGSFPEQVGIGIGALDPDLSPALDALEIDGTALFGFYVQEPDQPVWVLGVAGTEQQWAGVSSDLPGLSEGTYRFEGLYLIGTGEVDAAATADTTP